MHVLQLCQSTCMSGRSPALAISPCGFQKLNALGMAIIDEEADDRMILLEGGLSICDHMLAPPGSMVMSC